MLQIIKLQPLIMTAAICYKQNQNIVTAINGDSFLVLLLTLSYSFAMSNKKFIFNVQRFLQQRSNAHVGFIVDGLHSNTCHA